MASASSSWLARCAVLSEATQTLLSAAVQAAVDGDMANTTAAQLSTSAARFDSVAAALEEDLLTFSSHAASSCHPPPRTAALLRQLADEHPV